MTFSEKSKMKDLMANPEAKAVIEKYVPGFWDNPQSKQAFGMTLKMISSFPQAKVFKDNLDKIVEELSQIQE